MNESTSTLSPRSAIPSVYERASWQDACTTTMDDSVSLESVDLEQDFREDGDKPAHGRPDSRLHKQVSILRKQLARAEALNDVLYQEKSAQKRELLELKQTLKSNKVVQTYEARLCRMKDRIEFMEEERDHFIRQIRMLDDRIDELEKINEAQSCKLSVLELLYQSRDRENEEI